MPIITAASERVEVGNDFARTDIACNTGNGSKGSGFVTANAQPPILVASGNQGNRVIPRIRSGVFGLFGDAERRTLLSTVTVSGVAPELSHGQLRWLLFAVLLAVLYAALYLSSTGAVRTKFPLEPATSPRPLHIARNLLLGCRHLHLCGWRDVPYPPVQPRFWRPILTRGEWQPSHEPKKIALHRVSKRCWFWAIREWRRDFLPWLPTNSALSMDSSL